MFASGAGGVGARRPQYDDSDSDEAIEAAQVQQRRPNIMIEGLDEAATSPELSPYETNPNGVDIDFDEMERGAEENGNEGIRSPAAALAVQERGGTTGETEPRTTQLQAVDRKTATRPVAHIPGLGMDSSDDDDDDEEDERKGGDPKGKRTQKLEDAEVPPSSELTQEMEELLRESLHPNERVVWKQRRSEHRKFEIYAWMTLPVAFLVAPGVYTIARFPGNWTITLFIFFMLLALYCEVKLWSWMQRTESIFYAMTNLRVLHGHALYTDVTEAHIGQITRAIKYEHIKPKHIRMRVNKQWSCSGGDHVYYYRKGNQQARVPHGLEGIVHPQLVLEMLLIMVKQARRKASANKPAARRGGAAHSARQHARVPHSAAAHQQSARHTAHNLAPVHSPAGAHKHHHKHHHKHRHHHH